jgi:RNA-directed DNA polymerase
VRYADDCNIYVGSERAAQRVMERVSRFITNKLKLKVNGEKSAVGRPWERKFLGFSFTNEEEPRRKIAPKALKRFKERVRELTQRSDGVSMKRRIEKLAQYLKGWRGYYRFCETPSVLSKQDSWIRRRLRCVTWKQWKTGKRRYKELRRLGIFKDPAARLAASSLGPWPISKTATLNQALSNAYFDSLGLPLLAVSKISRIAVYGPVRTVV